MKGYAKLKVDLEHKEKQLEVEEMKSKLRSKCCVTF